MAQLFDDGSTVWDLSTLSSDQIAELLSRGGGQLFEGTLGGYSGPGGYEGPAVADPISAFEPQLATTQPVARTGAVGSPSGEPIRIWTGAGYETIPTIAASDLTFYDGKATVQPSMGDQDTAPRNAVDTIQTWQFKDADTASRYGGIGAMSPVSSNFLTEYDPQRPDQFTLTLKSADKAGTQVVYKKVGDQWVPEVTGEIPWDTTSNDALNIAKVVIGGPLLSAAGQAMTGAQGVAPTFGTELAEAGASAVGSGISTLPNGMTQYGYIDPTALTSTGAGQTMAVYGTIDTSLVPAGTTLVDGITGATLGTVNAAGELVASTMNPYDQLLYNNGEPIAGSGFSTAASGTPSFGQAFDVGATLAQAGEAAGSLHGLPNMVGVPGAVAGGAFNGSIDDLYSPTLGGSPGGAADFLAPEAVPPFEENFIPSQANPVSGPGTPTTTPPGTPPKSTLDKIIDSVIKNPGIIPAVIGTVGSILDKPDDPATGGGPGTGGGWNGPIQSLQAVQTRQSAPAGYRPGFSPEHVYIQTSYQGGAPTQPTQAVIAPPPDIPPLPPRRFAEGGSVMATNDVAARIAALQNLQPYTGSQITWPLAWGNLQPMGQTSEGYAVARQPGGDIMLADPNSYSGKTNNLLDMGSYLANGGTSGWSENGFLNAAPREKALGQYQVGIDANNGAVYDFGDGKLVSSNGAPLFNQDYGGSINPTAPADAYDPAKGYDAAKMAAAGYQQMSFGPNGVKPYDPVASFYETSSPDSSVGWAKQINGRWLGADGREIATSGQTAAQPYAYAGTPPVGSDFAWGAQSNEPRDYFNRDASTAYNYQPTARAGIASLPASQNSIAATRQVAAPQQYKKQFQQMPQAAPQQIRGAPPLYDPNDPTLREPTIGEYAAQPTAVRPQASGIANLPAAQTEAYRGLWAAPSGVQALMDRLRQSNVRKFAGGGFIQGPGTGTSDSIRGTIDGKEPVDVSTNEFVLPEWFVEAIGNGSAQAGAQRLYALMEQVKSRRSDPGAALTQMT